MLCFNNAAQPRCCFYRDRKINYGGNSTKISFFFVFLETASLHNVLQRSGGLSGAHPASQIMEGASLCNQNSPQINMCFTYLPNFCFIRNRSVNLHKFGSSLATISRSLKMVICMQVQTSYCHFPKKKKKKKGAYVIFVKSDFCKNK